MSKSNNEAPSGRPATLVLGKNEDRRLRAGHLWIYANEIDKARSPLKAFAPGDLIDIESTRGKWIGRGYVNPGALIAARVVTRSQRQDIDATLIQSRLDDALGLRERFYDRPYYRLVYGESDRLPGLVVDRYGDVFVLQANTAGMDRLIPLISECLTQKFEVSGIVARNDTNSREIEGLPLTVDTVSGTRPDRVRLEEAGVRFEVDVVGGQKTGWFFDQKVNRDWLAANAHGAELLDVFSYVGAWSVRALRAGAKRAVCIDSSEAALAGARSNAELNDVSAALTTHHGDALESLKAFAAKETRFDIVVLDPPAFIRRKKSTRDGLSAYQRLNEAAIRILKPDGLLVTCSCSYHASREEFQNAVRRAGVGSGRKLQLVHEGHQSPDHPIHPAMPETAYLKSLVYRVL